MGKETDSLESNSPNESPSAQAVTPEIPSKKEKIIYIWIEGMTEFEQKKIAYVKKKYTNAGRQFTAAQYKKDGTFDPDVPAIDNDTKVIVFGHGAPMYEGLSSKQSKENLNKVTLNYTTLAKEISKKTAPNSPVRVALYGCYTGVGANKTSHKDSMAGKLFDELQNRGYEPTISANLSKITFTEEGRTLKTIYGNPLWSKYHSQFGSSNELVSLWERLDKRLRVFDSKAQGSKVILSMQQNNTNQVVEYPYGRPESPIDKSQLHTVGKMTNQEREKFNDEFSQRYEVLHQKLKSEFDSLEGCNSHIDNFGININQTN